LGSSPQIGRLRETRYKYGIPTSSTSAEDDYANSTISIGLLYYRGIPTGAYSASAASLLSQGQLQIAGGSLTANGSVEVNNTLTISSAAGLGTTYTGALIGATLIGGPNSSLVIGSGGGTLNGVTTYSGMNMAVDAPLLLTGNANPAAPTTRRERRRMEEGRRRWYRSPAPLLLLAPRYGRVSHIAKAALIASRYR
jgi:hypothetical protein